MAAPRAIVKRRKTVRNIRKITRTMQLIATARFQAAYNRATAAAPYTEKLAELARDLAEASGELEHELMRTEPVAGRDELLVITSNRGLCGGYNSHVLRQAIGYLDERKAAGGAVDVRMVGKKGANYFRFLKRPVAEHLTGISETPRFEEVDAIANGLISRFVAGEIDSARVAYMRFLSVGQQRAEVVQLLPLEPGDEKDADAGDADAHQPAHGAGRGPQIEYEYSPPPAELLAELLPATVRIRLFQAFNEAVVSEHTARMVAMKAATDAAGDMIKNLTRQYNRARQTQITMELLDIVGGANALE